jgi:hypothetical protein
MNYQARQILEELRSHLRRASVAQVGGFRPPENPCASWFGRGVCLAGEALPTDKDGELFPLLQINMSELPYVPAELSNVKLLVLFHSRGEHPFDKPHGDGWLIREYASLEGLVLLPQSSEPEIVRPFPIRWSLVEDDAPGWEDAWSVVDLSSVNADDEASSAFFHDFSRYHQTKIGGYPYEIQHGIGLSDYVFQVGSEGKAGWEWVDGGIGYYFKDPSGEWRWNCQFD